MGYSDLNLVDAHSNLVISIVRGHSLQKMLIKGGCKARRRSAMDGPLTDKVQLKSEVDDIDISFIKNREAGISELDTCISH